jgi:hypothetical protein
VVVVAGWVVGAGYAWMEVAGKNNAVQVAGGGLNNGNVPYPLYVAMVVLGILFFFASPLYLAALCWKNVDWAVTRLLWQQFQFKMVLLLTAHIMVMDAWRLFYSHQSSTIVSAFCQSLLHWSPLLMVLFLDAMKRQSRRFRLAMPAAYLMYVLTKYLIFGFDHSPTPIPLLVHANSSDAFAAATAALGTFEGQITSSLSSIGLLMLSFFYSSMVDQSGTAVLFPLRFVTVEKNTVQLILDSGTWMRTASADGQSVVLAPKRAASVRWHRNPTVSDSNS